MKFHRQRAIVTGGSSGIGKATAKLLASQGFELAIIGRDRDKLEAAKQEIEAVKVNKNQKILAIAADVSDRFSIETAIQSSLEQLGGVDILIACAGIAHPDYFQKLPVEIFERSMAVNYFGTLYSIKAVLPAMERQKCGHLVVVSSGVGLIGIYGYTAYSPTKFALRGLAESLRGELKPLGINVSIVYPPDTDTPQLEQENKTKPSETKMITGTAQTWKAEAVAKEIVKGISNRTFAIAPGLEIKALNRWHSLLFSLLNWYFDRLIVKAQKHSKSSP
jgi:3-dehydrosphinganine reductase